MEVGGGHVSDSKCAVSRRHLIYGMAECTMHNRPKKHSVFCSVMPSPRKIHDLMKYYTLKITLLKQNII